MVRKENGKAASVLRVGKWPRAGVAFVQDRGGYFLESGGSTQGGP